MLELSASGLLIQITPTGGDTSARNTLLIYPLQHDARTPSGWKECNNSGCFILSDRSVLSLDASLVRLERCAA